MTTHDLWLIVSELLPIIEIYHNAKYANTLSNTPFHTTNRMLDTDSERLSYVGQVKRVAQEGLQFANFFCCFAFRTVSYCCVTGYVALHQTTFLSRQFAFCQVDSWLTIQTFVLELKFFLGYFFVDSCLGLVLIFVQIHFKWMKKREPQARGNHVLCTAFTSEIWIHRLLCHIAHSPGLGTCVCEFGFLPAHSRYMDTRLRYGVNWPSSIVEASLNSFLLTSGRNSWLMLARSAA